MARQTGIKLVGSVANGALTFALVVVITRGLGAGPAGAFFEALAGFFIVSSLSTLGADVGAVRMIARSRALGRREELRRILGLALVPVVVIGAVAAGALAIWAPYLARVVASAGHEQDVAGYVRVMAAFLPLYAVMQVALGACRGFGSIRPLVAIDDVGVPAARPLLAWAVIAAGLGHVALGLAWAAPLAVGAALAVAASWSLVRAEERLPQPAGAGPPGPATEARRLATEFWSFSSARALAMIFVQLVTWLDVLLLGALESTRAAGIYTAASRYLLVGSVFLQATVMVISPLISASLARSDQVGAERVFQASTWWLMAVSWPAYALLAVFSPLLLSVFGAEFVSGQTALSILALAMIVNMGTGPVSGVLLMAGLSMWNLANAFVALVINVALNVALIPRFGMTGAAAAFAASIVVKNVAAMVEVKMLLGLDPLGSGYWTAAGAACVFAVTGLAARSLLGPSPVALLASIAVGGPLYVALLWRSRERLQLSAIRGAFGKRFAARRA